MRNVTVSLPEDTVRWLRVAAAKADRSVSGWLADLLDKMLSCMTGPVFVDTNVLVYRRPLTAGCC